MSTVDRLIEVHDPATELMKTLAEGIEADEAFADHFAVLAADASSNGQSDFVRAFIDQCRLHRAKAIELRARLGAMVEQYGALHIEQL